MNNVKKTLVSVDTVRVVYKENERDVEKLYSIGGALIKNREMLAISQEVADALAVGDRDKAIAEADVKECERILAEAESTADKLMAKNAKKEALRELYNVYTDALKSVGITHLMLHKRYFEEDEKLFDIVSGSIILDKEGNPVISKGGRHYAVTLPEE